MSYDVKWNKKARKAMNKLDKAVRGRIWHAVDKLKNETAPMKKMVREGDEFCARAGDYRIIFEIHGEKIIIQEVGHRSEIYK